MHKRLAKKETDCFSMAAEQMHQSDQIVSSGYEEWIQIFLVNLKQLHVMVPCNVPTFLNAIRVRPFKLSKRFLHPAFWIPVCKKLTQSHAPEI